MKIKVVVFDFDGVLVDSVGLKNQAFEEIYQEHFGELTLEVQEYINKNGGLERAKRFTHFYQSKEGRDPSEDELELLSKLFALKVKQVMIDRALMPKVLNTLEALKNRKVPMYIASGTPHEELQDICFQIGVKEYFEDIYGAPNSKASVIQKVAPKHALPMQQVLMVGDSITDWNAAHMTQCQFLGIRSQYTIFPEGTELCDTIETVLRKV
jgi:phosphoglycolate phosphatase